MKVDMVYKKRYCKKCDTPIAPENYGFNNYDREGLCGMCGDYCSDNNTLEKYKNMKEVKVKTDKKSYDEYLYYNF